MSERWFDFQPGHPGWPGVAACAAPQNVGHAQTVVLGGGTAGATPSWLTDADVDRIARRVAELLRKETP